MKKILSYLYKIHNRLSREVHQFYYRLYNSIIGIYMQKNEGAIIEPRQLKGVNHISIGKNTRVLHGAILTAWETEKYGTPLISIGDNTNIGEHSHITAANSIRIGNNVLTGRYVFISDNSHGQFCIDQLDMNPLLRPLNVKGPVVIEDNVWICERCCILSGVTIGKGSIIAANAVVTHDIPPYSIAAGVPATVIKSISKNE